MEITYGTTYDDGEGDGDDEEDCEVEQAESEELDDTQPLMKDDTFVKHEPPRKVPDYDPDVEGDELSINDVSSFVLS